MVKKAKTVQVQFKLAGHEDLRTQTNYQGLKTTCIPTPQTILNVSKSTKICVKPTSKR